MRILPYALGTLFAAVVAATATVRYQVVGPAPTAWGQELCSPFPLHPCREGVLQGGWPLPFLHDSPGVSVMGQLAFVEDRFALAPYLVDVVVWWLPLSLVGVLWGLRRPDYSH